MSESGTTEGKFSELEQLLAEKIRLDSMLMEKYSRKVTVMFTDIKGSTTYYETRGDLAGRAMIHQHNAIVLPVIEQYGGTLLKTIGDATMSLYADPAHGMRAAAGIQLALQKHNAGRPAGERISVRCGLNSGVGLVEDSDVYGDVVNVASRIEGLASGGEVYLSGQLYDDLRQADEFIFRYVTAAAVKGKEEPVKIYRLVWNVEELRLGKTRGGAGPAGGRRAGYYSLEVTCSGDRLKVSGSFHADGEAQPVKQCQEIAYDREAVESSSSRIIEIFNRAGGAEKASNEFLSELRQRGGELYAALIPGVIRKGLSAAPEVNLLISMDESLVHIPWEMLYDGTGFICQKFGIGRTVSTSHSVSGSGRVLTPPLRMLLLCDPQGNLPAAARECSEIIDVTAGFPDSISITSKNAPIDSSSVTGRIHSFDIVHFAGHAEQDGWLLQDAPLTAAMISKLAGELPMPALVFSNACHTGEWQSGEAYMRQRVFTLANAFLLCGVQHYIGTLRDIPDEPGRRFARSFYEHLVQGVTIGEAMLLARIDVIDEFGEDAVFWGSFLLYGDPTTRYIAAAQSAAPSGVSGAGPGTESGTVPPPAAAVPKQKGKRALIIAGALMAIAGAAGGYLLNGGGMSRTVPVVERQSTVDSDRQLDELVRSLAQDYRNGRPQQTASPSDGWTSVPFSLAIMEISGGSDLLIEQLNQGLSSAGISIVERKLLNRLLTELKLSSAALTDPATSLRLGKLLSARIMVTGVLSREGGKSRLILKFIDTETSEVRKMLTVESAGKEFGSADSAPLAGQISAWGRDEFPVRGRITAVAGGQVRINIGRQHGLKKNDLLEAVAEQGKGSGLYTPVARIRLTELEKGSASGMVEGNSTGLAQDVRVQLKQ